MNLICKLFKFILKLFGTIVDFVASTVKLIGTAAVEVLGDLVGTIGDEVSGLLGGSFLGSAIKLGIVGAGAYLLFGLLGDDDDGTTPSVAANQQNANTAVVASQPDF